jgi:hypothetical protein
MFRNTVTAVIVVLALPFTPQAEAGTARLQVIHNSADALAEYVDVYVNGDLLLDDFGFRTATPFMDVPSGVELIVGVAPGNSSSSADALAEFPIVLEHGETYVAVANGVLDPASYSANPDGAGIGFSLYPKDGIRESAMRRWRTDFIMFHGATDAPSVDVRRHGYFSWPLASGLSYGEFSRYRWLFPAQHTLDITPAGNPSTVVASFDVNLSGLGGGSAVVFVSGFLNPGDNGGGPALGVFAAFPDGQVVEFPMVGQLARLQVIHNSAEIAAAEVDVYVNDDLFLDDFAFRTATPFVDVPAGVSLNIGIAPSNSGSVNDVIATFPVTLESGETYVAVANGVLDPGSYAPNPDGRSTAFTLYAVDGVSESSRWPFFIRLLAFHGSTDAPAVDIFARTKYFRFRLFDDLAYGDLSTHRVVFPGRYTLEVTPGSDNGTVVASFDADLSGLGGGAAFVFASGFLNPAVNQNGAGFGLFAALPDGQVIALPAASGALALENSEVGMAKAASLPESFSLSQNYPNPFNPSTTISFSLPAASDVSLKVFNVLGQEVKTLIDGPMNAGKHSVQFDAANLASGIYFYRINAGSFMDTRKMLLTK